MGSTRGWAYELQTHDTVNCFRLCSLPEPHVYPDSVSARLTSIDRTARAYCCSLCGPRVCVYMCRAHWHEPPLSNTSDKEEGWRHVLAGELEDTDRAMAFISAHFHIIACVSGELYLFDSFSQVLQICDPAMVGDLAVSQLKTPPSRCEQPLRRSVNDKGGRAGERSGCELRSPLYAKFVPACESVGQSSRKPFCTMSLQRWKEALILSESERKHQHSFNLKSSSANTWAQSVVPHVGGRQTRPLDHVQRSQCQQEDNKTTEGEGERPAHVLCLDCW